jgi:hypothetical protein
MSPLNILRSCSIDLRMALGVPPQPLHDSVRLRTARPIVEACLMRQLKGRTTEHGPTGRLYVRAILGGDRLELRVHDDRTDVLDARTGRMLGFACRDSQDRRRGAVVSGPLSWYDFDILV